MNIFFLFMSIFLILNSFSGISAPANPYQEDKTRKNTFEESYDYLMKEGRHELNSFCNIGRTYNKKLDRSYWNKENIDDSITIYRQKTSDMQIIKGLLGAKAYAMSKVCPDVW